MNRFALSAVVGLVGIAAAGCSPVSLSPSPQSSGYATLSNFACPNSEGITVSGQDGVNVNLYAGGSITAMSGGPVFYTGGGQSIRFSGDYRAVLWTKTDGTRVNCALNGYG